MPRADVVVGGPPCQGFSALGRRDPNDPRNKLWRHYVDVLDPGSSSVLRDRERPSVPALNRVRESPTETSPSAGLAPYELEPFVLNAADYGDPAGHGSERSSSDVGRELAPVGATPDRRRPMLGEALPAWLDAQGGRHDIPSGTIEFRGHGHARSVQAARASLHARAPAPVAGPLPSDSPRRQPLRPAGSSYRLLVGANTLAALATSWGACRGTSPP